MEDERTHEVHRYAQTLDDIITADHCFNDDFLLADMYNVCGASTSSTAFLEAASDRTPLGSLDDAFMDSYDALLRSDHFQLSAHHTLAVSCGSGHMETILDGSRFVSAGPANVDDPSDAAPLRDRTYERSNSAFVEWKIHNNVDFLQPKKSQCLLKRCIRLLKDIDSHKIVRSLGQSRQTDSTGSDRFGTNYDKLAIHHVVAERRRREQMNEIFSALRALIPVSPKKGRATVLQHTKDYVIHLKSRIEELERRNRELEELLSAQSARRGH